MPPDVRCYTPPRRASAAPIASGDKNSDSDSLSSISLENQATHTREKQSRSLVQTDTGPWTSLQKPDDHYWQVPQNMQAAKDTIMIPMTDRDSQMSLTQKPSLLSTGSDILHERLSDPRSEQIATRTASPSFITPFPSIPDYYLNASELNQESDLLLRSTKISPLLATHRRASSSNTVLTKPSSPTLAGKWELLSKEDFLQRCFDNRSDPTYRLPGSDDTPKTPLNHPEVGPNEPIQTHSFPTTRDQYSKHCWLFW